MLNAEEARKLATQANDKTEDITGWCRVINERIERAAKNGQTSIDRIFSGFRMPCSENQKRSIRATFVNLGYHYEDERLSW